MSSILKALKKVEMESAAQAEPTMPWQAPSSLPPLSSSGVRRWWIIAGFLAVIVVSGVIYWQLKRAGSPGGTETADQAPAEDKLAKGRQPEDGALEKSKSSSQMLPHAKPVVGTKSVTASRPEQKNRYLTAITPETTARKGALEKAETKPPAAVPATPLSDMPISRAEVPYEKEGKPAKDTMGAFQTSENAADEGSAGGGGNSQEEEEKTYRQDPRITLQAVVWAPEPESRFVVINNKMIREGGLVDNIVVEKINPDDVLLSEGANRWYVAFTIR